MAGAGDRTSVSKQRKDRKFFEDRDALFLRRSLETVDGRAVIWRLIGYCGVHRASFGGMDHSHTDFREGQRAVGLEVINWVWSLDPQWYMLMQSEAMQRDEMKLGSSQNARSGNDANTRDDGSDNDDDGSEDDA